MKGYTNEQEIENYLLIDIDESFATQVQTWIGFIEDFIDKATGRNFKADTADTNRLFSGDGTDTLLIDDAICITKLEVGTATPLTEIVAADYLKYPLNYAAKGVPITKVVLKNSSFDRDAANVKITGKFGYSATPPPGIKFAATVFTAGIINYGDTGEGEIKSESIGSYSVTYKDEKQWQDFEQAKQILKQYKKFTF